MFALERFCTDKGIPVLKDSGHHHTSIGWVQLHCPFCSGGVSGWHLGWHVDTGHFHCWRCGGLKLWDMIGAWLNTSTGAVIYRTIQEYQTDTRVHQKQKAPRRRTIKFPLRTERLCKAHIKYLRSRGFDSLQLVKTWDLTGTMHLSGIWNWRIIIPIHNADGTVVAYTGRSIKDAKPKYRTVSDKDALESPADQLYGIHKVTGDAVMIVEGPIDVWRLGPGAVATLGVDWTQVQANKLRRFKRRYVMYDPEAEQEGKDLAHYLSLFPGETEILSGLDTDPGDMSSTDAQQLMEELDIAP